MLFYYYNNYNNKQRIVYNSGLSRLAYKLGDRSKKGGEGGFTWMPHTDLCLSDGFSYCKLATD